MAQRRDLLSGIGGRPRGGRDMGLRRRKDAPEERFPGLKVVMSAVDFVFDGREGLEEKLADVGENGGVARRDAIVGHGGPEPAESVIDVGGRLEVAGEGREFRADAVGFEELLLLAGMDEAVLGVMLPAEHAAEAAVGEVELTEIG